MLHAQESLKISKQMIKAVSEKDSMNEQQFTKLLDLHPVIRSIIVQALTPQIWVFQANLPEVLKVQDLYKWEV